MLLTPTLGRAGLPLFAASLGICCFGAAVELALATAYMVAQTFGWNWSEDDKPHRQARFAVTYSAMFLGCGIIVALGIDPLHLTMYAMALTAAILPLVVVPFLLLMNDREYMREYRNGAIGNSVVVFISILSAVVAIVTIPLEILGS